MASAATMHNTTAAAADIATTASSSAPGTPKHTIGGSKLSTENANTFSPLSSSTITISSLGLSLELGTPINGLTLVNDPATKTPATDIFDQGGQYITDMDEGFDHHDDAAHDLAIRRLSCNANINRDSFSSSMSSTASDSSSNGSIIMPSITMRSVSADYSRVYGMQMRNLPPRTNSNTRQAISFATSRNQPTDAELVLSQGFDEQEPLPANTVVAVEVATPAELVEPAEYSKTDVVHRSLAKKLLHPLSWMQPTGAVAAAGDSQVSRAKDATNLNVDAPSTAAISQLQGGSVALRNCIQRKSMAAVRQNDVSQLFQDISSSGEATAETSNPNISQTAAPVVKLISNNTVGTAEPLLKSRRPQQSAVPSKSLDIGRSAVTSRLCGPLSRHAMQRSKASEAPNINSATEPDAMGPARFQALPRSLVSRFGFSNILALRRQPGDLRFIIAPHPRFSEVVEVIDCDEMAPVYRKVSRSGKSWHETFHEVDPEDSGHGLGALRGYDNVATLADTVIMSDYEMASALGLPYPGAAFANYGSMYSGSGYTSPRNSDLYYSGAKGGNISRRTLAGNAAASCVTFQSSSVSSSVADNNRRMMNQDAGTNGFGIASAMGLSNQSTASFLNPSTARILRASASMGMYGLSSVGSGENASFDKGLLWEALTPYPNQFPLHIKGARTIEDSISLASLVLDRHLFCYRFQLGANKMRWTAKRTRKHQLALQCFVRSALVAEVFVDYERGYSPYSVSNAKGQKKNTVAPQQFASNSSSRTSTPAGADILTSSINNSAETATDLMSALPNDGSYPIITILPVAFTQLSAFDSDIVESFIVFTGMQMLECLHV
ncbi:hypothetical protein LPJ66_000590 [Kickxella alabastrina]|uniref:Uncharacterized protein n=1 Tax=Kickxella alabastrina TaxID=61397 RepID=A0ACC1IVL7_9FUNG|nr:hypothetical protein LPJ66_000590 [Kickxella alabastrina]